MEKELTEQALQQLLEWAQRGDAFVSEQAPLVAQEIVTWGVVSGVLQMICGVILMAAFILLAWAAIKVKRHIDDGTLVETFWATVAMIGVCGGWALPLFGCAVFWQGLSQAAQAYFAPRLYVIEQVTQMIGGG